MLRVMIIQSLSRYIIVALVGAVIAGYIASALSGSKNIGIIAGILVAMFICLVPYMKSPRCESCNAKMKFGESYCTECGHQQEPADVFDTVKCNNCGRRVDKDSKHCGYCGNIIE